jgi:hypothetical protein
MLNCCKSGSNNKAFLHSCPWAVIFPPSRYNCLILVRFWRRLCRFGFSSFGSRPDE